MKKIPKNFDIEMYLKQVESEYEIGYNFMDPKWSEWQTRLKIYNNQLKDKKKVGSKLMFTYHQTLLASLYSDSLEATFVPREEGDALYAEIVTDTAKYDFVEMGKPEIDYEWDWDTTFFGYGLLAMQNWDSKRNCPVPKVIDPMTYIRDPFAKSIKGDPSGEGKSMFGGRWIYLAEHELRARVKSGQYFLVDSIDEIQQNNKTTKVEENKKLRLENLGYSNSAEMFKLTGASKIYKLLEWWNFNEDGNVMFGVLANDNKKVLSIVNLERKTIPIVQRKLNPASSVFDGTSVPDLVEDIHRHNAIALNLSLDTVKAGLYPRYIVDQNLVKNKADLANYSFDQYIFVDGAPGEAIKEIPRQQIKSDVSWILNELDRIAQKATATPDIQQGVASKSNRTASENAMVQENVDTRYGLSAKIFGWSEKDFWREWYGLYKENFSSASEKIVRISGESGNKWKKITRENMLFTTDPDIEVVSSEVARRERLEKQQAFTNLAQLSANDPTVNKQYILKKLARLSGLNQDEIDHVFQKTADEYVALRENEMLSDGVMQEVHAEDDDYAHIDIHRRAANTPETRAHIKTHEKALFEKKTRPDLQAQSQSPMSPRNMASTQPMDAPSQPKMNYGITPNLANQPAQNG